jgi:hypothetical protein
MHLLDRTDKVPEWCRGGTVQKAGQRSVSMSTRGSDDKPVSNLRIATLILSLGSLPRPEPGSGVRSKVLPHKRPHLSALDL